MSDKGWLALEDGRAFEGRLFGARHDAAGEVVFNTALTGYQEVLTDPSYAGQIVTMTSVHVGNYGVNDEDLESARPQVAGFVLRELSAVASSWRATGPLGEWLEREGIAGIQEVDTRALTRHLRSRGAMRGAIGAGAPEALVDRARAARSMVGLDLASEVTCEKPWDFGPSPGEARYRVVAYDFGIKRNILRMLAAEGCSVTVVPAGTTAAEAMALGPDGIFLSNGPGDPEPLQRAVAEVRELMRQRPVFGICLGHQVLSLACGARTFKLKFGHRGVNHPVKHLATGRVEITSQNHGFAVDPAVYESDELEQTHVNLNDGTDEGFRHRSLPVMSVQYHPEASPGPHDSHYLFREFAAMMERESTRSGGRS